MRRPERMGSVRPPQAEQPKPVWFTRDRIALIVALVTLVCVFVGFVFSKGAHSLMPGPLASAHGAIENCGSCHTKSGNGKFSWLHGLVAGDPVADSKACITCHKMPDNIAFNAHGASTGVLKQSTERLTRVAAGMSAPQSARAQHIAFPTDKMAADGLTCATCHQDHQGANFDLNKMSNEQCRSCHVVKFDSFDGNHPTFEDYPFERRTRIIYDHASHFGKHFPEVAKKDPKKRIPETCSTCHNSNDDKRVMGVASFDQTCATCHLDQIMGKERVSGPKGIAFLSLPGLDLETLRAKNAAIGDWPDASLAELTPFMKVLLSQDEPGRALIKRVEKLNLQDLTDASADDIAVVTKFVWRVKKLFHSLVVAKPSDVLAKLDLGGGVKVGKDLIISLTASLPRDVIVGAQREWLPNLGREMANRKDATTNAPLKKKISPGETKLAAQVTPEELRSASPKPAATTGEIRLAQADTVQRAPDQTDDLLFPDGGQAPAAGSGGASKADEVAPPANEGNGAGKSAPPSPAAAAREAPSAAVIESDIDAESWADFGGWYRQDFAIFYRPTGHKDKFIYSWVTLTGRQSPKGLVRPAAAVFDALTGKDSQGSCAKCHSVDDQYGKGRHVNFSPIKAKAKDGRFTTFIHEPHYGVMENRGCLTCHNLEKNRPYLKSYEDGDPLRFTPNFGNVKKDLCQTCHKASAARQDCLTCHKYHINEIVTPIMSTKNPAE